MKTETIAETLETYMNGNITDAKNSVKKMSKLELLVFIEMMEMATGRDNTLTPIINIVKNLLK